MGVPPKSSIFFLGFSIINHLFGGYPHDLGTPRISKYDMCIYVPWSKHGFCVGSDAYVGFLDDEACLQLQAPEAIEVQHQNSPLWKKLSCSLIGKFANSSDLRVGSANCVCESEALPGDCGLVDTRAFSGLQTGFALGVSCVRSHVESFTCNYVGVENVPGVSAQIMTSHSAFWSKVGPVVCSPTAGQFLPVFPRTTTDPRLGLLDEKGELEP